MLEQIKAIGEVAKAAIAAATTEAEIENLRVYENVNFLHLCQNIESDEKALKYTKIFLEMGVNPNKRMEEWLDITSLEKEYEFHFPEIKCKRLYILINQIHCIKDTYLISSDQMFKNELWFNVANPDSENLLTDNTTVFKPMYLDRASDDPVWLYINNKMNTNKQLNINDLLINNKNKMLSNHKF